MGTFLKMKIKYIVDFNTYKRKNISKLYKKMCEGGFQYCYFKSDSNNITISDLNLLEVMFLFKSIGDSYLYDDMNYSYTCDYSQCENKDILKKLEISNAKLIISSRSNLKGEMMSYISFIELNPLIYKSDISQYDIFLERFNHDI